MANTRSGGKTTSGKPVGRAESKPASPTPRRASNAGRKPAGDARAMPRAKDSAPKKRRWPLVLIVCVVVVIVAAIGAFSWDRWFRYDDTADIQGVWKVSGAQSTTVIDGSVIKLTSDVSYAYTIDTLAKTIDYSFGSSSGHASYRFSDDRSVLVIQENAGTEWLVALRLKKDPVIEGGETPTGTTVLVRVSGNTTAQPQSLANNSTAAADAAGAVLDGSAS